VIKITQKPGQISKVAEIHGLGLYCDVLHGCHDAEASEKLLHTWTEAVEAVKNDFIVAPFDASFLVEDEGDKDNQEDDKEAVVKLTKAERRAKMKKRKKEEKMQAKELSKEAEQHDAHQAEVMRLHSTPSVQEKKGCIILKGYP
ncbi:hypothetical protein Droror1_Dr00008458, partial [Drosera rotundifolia]